MTRIEYRTSNGRQVAFYAPPKSGGIPKRLWFQFGGNGSLALQYHGMIEQPEFAECGVLMIDYPGYGYDEGTPSAIGIQENADAALAALAVKLKTSSQILLNNSATIGHSIGTGTSLEFAVAHPEIRRVVLVAPFTSLYDRSFSVVGPLALLLHHNYDNEAALTVLGLRQPRPEVYIFHGDRDRIISVTMSRRLKAEFPWVTYTEFAGQTHALMQNTRQHQIARIAVSP